MKKPESLGCLGSERVYPGAELDVWLAGLAKKLNKLSHWHGDCKDCFEQKNNVHEVVAELGGK